MVGTRQTALHQRKTAPVGQSAPPIELNDRGLEQYFLTDQFLFRVAVAIMQIEL